MTRTHLLVVRLHASDVMRLRLEQRLHQRVELRLELLRERGLALARAAVVLRVEDRGEETKLTTKAIHSAGQHKHC